LIVTNQPDIEKGLMNKSDLDLMHEYLMSELAIDKIYVCYCVEGPECSCYKPQPGLLKTAAEEWNINSSDSFMVGDRWRDIGAGKNFGCKTVFIDNGYTEELNFRPDYIANSLIQASQIITGKAV